MNKRTGFHIGQDFARYGRTPPEDCPGAVFEGYKSATNTIRRQRSNRFINKWLQLRYNAFTRGKLFSSEITPDLIQSIDTENCPITGIRLTHGTGSDTDWSVDRIANSFDYIPTNIVVMSVRANRAKGDKSPDEVMSIAESINSACDGLQPEEWRRLAELVQWAKFRQMSEKELDEIDSTELFIASLFKGDKPFEHTSYSQIGAFQMYLLHRMNESTVVPTDIDRVLNRNKAARVLFHKLWNRLVKRKPKYLPEEQYRQWGNQGTLLLYVRWIMHHDINELGNFLKERAGSTLVGSLASIQSEEERYQR